MSILHPGRPLKTLRRPSATHMHTNRSEHTAVPPLLSCVSVALQGVANFTAALNASGVRVLWPYVPYNSDCV